MITLKDCGELEYIMTDDPKANTIMTVRTIYQGQTYNYTKTLTMQEKLKLRNVPLNRLWDEWEKGLEQYINEEITKGETIK